MGDLRFICAAIAVFAAAFVGMSFGLPWASKGLSVAAVNSTPAKPDAPAPQMQPPAIVEAPAERAAPRPPPAREVIAAPAPARSRQFASMPATVSPRPRSRPRKPTPARRATAWPRPCSSLRLRPICALRISHRRRRRMRAFTTPSRSLSRPATSALTSFPRSDDLGTLRARPAKPRVVRQFGGSSTLTKNYTSRSRSDEWRTCRANATAS